MNVAVAICTHNGARFIRDQLESLGRQTLRPIEVVVSDDDSSDATVAVARESLDAGIRLRVIENRPALGITKNFEAAVRAAAESGAELIALCDQDDVWHADKLERATRVFAADQRALLLFTDARLVDDGGAALGRGLFESLSVTESALGRIEAGGALGVFLRRNLATGATVVFRRELLDLALPFPSTWIHDEWLAMVAALQGGVRVLRERTIDYRQHGSNEIGVVQPTLRYKVRRMLQRRGTRNLDLAAKFADLADWARSAPVSSRDATLIAMKARFELRRAQMPPMRIARIPAILQLAAQGLYPRFASQGRLDMLRDLLQRP